MRTKLTTFALAGAVGLTAVTGAALLAPAVSYAATGDSTALQSRVSSITQALGGLVGDGTLTQAQADRVASTLAEARPEGLGHRGPGGRGLHLEAAAEALGVPVEELRTAAEAGRSLADVAQEKGVSTDALVDALVKAQQDHLAAAVSSGRLTQAEADEKAADLQARITERLDDPIRARGGHRGRDHEQATPDSSASPTPSA